MGEERNQNPGSSEATGLTPVETWQSCQKVLFSNSKSDVFLESCKSLGISRSAGMKLSRFGILSIPLLFLVILLFTSDIQATYDIRTRRHDTNLAGFLFLVASLGLSFIITSFFLPWLVTKINPHE
jgi:hypothetical protein